MPEKITNEQFAEFVKGKTVDKFEGGVFYFTDGSQCYYVAVYPEDDWMEYTDTNNKTYNT